MLILLLSIGAERYGIDASKIFEVGPLVSLRSPPHSPPEFLGWCNYRGQVTPVVDLTRLLSGKRSQDFLSTRLLFIDLPRTDGGLLRLGLAAEQVTETFQVTPDRIQPASLHLKDAPYLDGVIVEAGGLIQIIRTEKILSDSLREALDLKGPEA